MTVHRTIKAGLAPLAVLAFSLAALPAVAADLNPSFYVAGQVARDRNTSLSIDGGPITGNLQVGSEWGYGGAVGVKLMDLIRVEAEYMHRSADPSNLEGLNLSINSGSVRSDTLMVNALVDMKLVDRITPFIGFGAGWARVEMNGVNAGFISFDGEDDAFAWQGIFGVSVQVADQLSVYVDGRYLRTGDIAFDVGPGALFEASTKLERWSATAGVRWSF